MNILGISAFYHDSAACLLRDGSIIAAAQEERFTRKKHDPSFPANAVNYCLEQGGIKTGQIDYIAFYDKPFLKLERILQTYLAYAPRGFSSFFEAVPLWLKEKIWTKEIIKSKLGLEGKIIFTEHHQAHAASAFFPSPFAQAAFLTADGVGEWATTSYGIGENNSLKILADIRFPHSLGLLYSTFTYYAGFKVNSGEYKLMGLAPYGEPKYKDIILKELIDLKEDGSFRLNMKYFNYCAGRTMTNRNFHRLFGGLPRKPEAKITQRDMDIARSIQEVTEEAMLRLARYAHRQSRQENLCLAGGVALNCVACGRILREGPFSNIWVQPAAGDAGGALGAALFVWYQYLQNKRIANNKDAMQAAYLGPSFSNAYIKSYLNDNNIVYTELKEAQIPPLVADLLNAQKVIGWFQGRMEFGPRALGNRSIIGDARSLDMQEIMNLKIKFRESFRPFAPSVLKEKAGEYFVMDRQSPYMLFAMAVSETIRNDITPESGGNALEKLRRKRSSIPAVTHVDFSARVQTVSKQDNPLFYQVIAHFNDKYKCPVIINTSFNVRGEPIVCTPSDAYLCFMRTNMDYLVMGNFLLKKQQQKPLDKDKDYLKEFELD